VLFHFEFTPLEGVTMKTPSEDSQVLEFIDVSFGENHPKTLVFIRVNTSVFTKTLSINSSKGHMSRHGVRKGWSGISGSNV